MGVMWDDGNVAENYCPALWQFGYVSLTQGGPRGSAALLMSETIVHGIDPVKLAKYFVQVCKRGRGANRRESHPTQIEGLRLINKDEAQILYQDGTVWTQYQMGSVLAWLQGMLEEKGVLKKSPKEHWSQFVFIDEIETDSDNKIIRIRYSIKKVMDFLDSKNPNRSIWSR